MFDCCCCHIGCKRCCNLLLLLFLFIFFLYLCIRNDRAEWKWEWEWELSLLSWNCCGLGRRFDALAMGTRHVCVCVCVKICCYLLMGNAIKTLIVPVEYEWNMLRNEYFMADITGSYKRAGN